MDKQEKLFRKALKSQYLKCGYTPSEAEKELQKLYKETAWLDDMFDSMFPQGLPTRPTKPGKATPPNGVIL